MEVSVHRVPVVIQRTNGQVEEGWMVTNLYPTLAMVSCMRPKDGSEGKNIYKIVSLTHILELNPGFKIKDLFPAQGMDFHAECFARMNFPKLV